MRTWIKADRLQWCGHCDREIPKGEPVQQIRIKREPYLVDRIKYRCPACADGPVPPDLQGPPQAADAVAGADA